MTTFEIDQHGASVGRVMARESARKRLEAQRGFVSDIVAYVVVNAFLIGVWAFTGAGYFWPAWVLAGWGAALALHGWDVYGRRPITEADIDDELRRSDGPAAPRA